MEIFISTIAYTLPSVIVAITAYYFFKQTYKGEENRRRYTLLKENQKISLPLRLQAYERMILFLDRISPQKLLMRVAPPSNNKSDYERLLVQQIDEEFDHNTAQQIYMTENTWNVVKAAKNATIQIIRGVSAMEDVPNAEQMRIVILKEFLNKPTPSSNASSHVISEVQNIIG